LHSPRKGVPNQEENINPCEAVGTFYRDTDFFLQYFCRLYIESYSRIRYEPLKPIYAGAAIIVFEEFVDRAFASER
jgi:hypothetical protein